MKFQDTTEHAIRFLTYMAKDPSKRYSTKEIAVTLDIPYKYMTKIVTLLSKAGLIESKKGSQGGVSLQKEPSKITVKDILEVLGDFSLDRCILGDHKCNPDGVCAMHESWVPTRIKLEETFSTTTLETLAKNERV
ncbi:MAG: Rrf2 family transcriptional regulator [Epsilonproteobacteria bacterium]|nr:Rrf2 family transcriptional regulator [Campylobacterota bacterium]